MAGRLDNDKNCQRYTAQQQGRQELRKKALCGSDSEFQHAPKLHPPLSQKQMQAQHVTVMPVPQVQLLL